MFQFFAVFTFNEALELRDAGITEDVLVFCRPTKQMLEIAYEKNITLNLCDPDDISLFREAKHSPKFHLKVDTGMTRLGVSFDEAHGIIETIKNEKLNCHGIYSHYATADEGDLHYAEYQLGQFNQLLDYIKKINLAVQFVHFSNSGTVINMPHSSYNLVRVGLLLYGSFPSDEVPRELPIKPVMEFKGPVVSLRKVKAGTKVSYGGVWESKKDTVIGVIQTGFADGFPREWYLNGFISFKGSKYSIAGRACMDQFMVDFGDADVKVGDEVLIFGQNNLDKILVDDIAKDIEKVFENCSKVVAVHSEDEEILNKNKKLIKNRDVHSHPVWRSEECAISSTRRIVRIAERHKKKTHILHITTKRC